MTLQEIVNKINSNEYFMNSNFDFETAKLWSNYGKTRIYIGRQFIAIENGKAVVTPYVPTRGYYESSDSYIDRCEKNTYFPIDVVARYINILLTK